MIRNNHRAPPDTAFRLAARGIPVFPCNEHKKPTTKHGFLDAELEPEKISALWGKFPGPLIGVPTGPASGIDVLDIDPKHGGDAWLETNQNHLPVTRIHRTRSGGEHWTFRHHPGMRNTQSKLADGVDTRGEGGYIIWWPGFGGQVVCNAAPAPWPAWLLELLLPKPKNETVRAAWAAKLTGDDTAARRLIQHQLDRVANAPPGKRHERLRNAALTIGGVVGNEGAGRNEAARQLLSAVLHAGGDDVKQDNAELTIAWGLDHGAAKPLRLRGQNA